MARRKKEKQFFRYDCTLSGETFKTTRKMDKTDDLISINSYYEMHPEKDDRPEHIKIKVEEEKKRRIAAEEMKNMLMGEN